MKRSFLTLVLGLTCTCDLAWSQMCRETVTGEECQFPFILIDGVRQVRYFRCTTDYDEAKRPWCSTKTHPNRTHIIGNWAYCAKTCSNNRNSFVPKSLTSSFTTTTTPIPVDPSTLGTWLPNLDNNESCGVDLNSNQIIGGKTAKVGQFPYLALLGYWRRGMYFYACGGTLINRRYVITAAHCQGSTPPKRVRQVVLGETTVGKEVDCLGCSPPLKFEIVDEDVIVHENWDPDRFQNGDDIALIRLPRLVDNGFDRYPQIIPICLPWVVGVSDPNSVYSVAGWGRTDNQPVSKEEIKSTGVLSTSLQFAQVPWVSFTECRKFQIYAGLKRGKHICAGGVQGIDSCSGDSGGPLLAQPKTAYGNAQKDLPYFLRGIVSFGTQTCGSGYPGVYTNIDMYLDWIQDQLQP
ncbi:phenoloxidase-activating factor 1-like [Tigriopus californicus]|uniref:phenoloxidase-activating factor 1-like n=1 Tax=Tigriopus californicus TaxID=6832 RepID=UPI0027DA08A6|nr:phenoloxidase-activating factor 1-like [Tigriopus californicus]|eukprot:TCALIF_05923-PA protein Name:"Similar to ea Serine protease easter (Drosophila melanogaster)" AED:0.34 eAED:0.34 QI:103/1/1/1/1/1/2/152/406